MAFFFQNFKHKMKLSFLIFFPFFSNTKAFVAHQSLSTLTEKYLADLSPKQKIHEGMVLPKMSFRTQIRNADNPEQYEWKTMTTDDYFANKNCILFAVPGAFTPTCSARHLPGYQYLFEQFRALDIDEIYCISVNDIFVLQKWGEDQKLTKEIKPHSMGFKEINFIPDGTAKFTRKMGMQCFWDKERGFGERSWRYSAHIFDGVVQKVFIEKPFIHDSKEDPFEVSDSQTMLKYLYDSHQKIPPDSFYGRDYWTDCDLF